MNIAVFAYNFPHKKTQDFLVRLHLENARVRLVLAADPVKLDIPPPSIRTKLHSDGGLLHPKKVAERFGWRYEVVEHNSSRSEALIKEERIDAAIIAGARVLKASVIATVPLGIINFHPGMLPEVRGLDAMQWALHEGHPLGVTAHIIDHRVDAGVVLLRRKIKLCRHDTVFDVSHRLVDIQSDMLPEALNLLAAGTSHLPRISGGKLHGKMPAALEKQVPRLLRQRVLDEVERLHLPNVRPELALACHGNKKTFADNETTKGAAARGDRGRAA